MQQSLGPNILFASSNYQLKDRVAMKRLGTPEDVAALVSFLVRDESSFITGESLLVVYL